MYLRYQLHHDAPVNPERLRVVVDPSAVAKQVERAVVAKLSRQSLCRGIRLAEANATSESVQITSIQADNDRLRVQWEDGRLSAFLYLMLRDNCRCQLCRHEEVGDRLIDPALIMPDIRPERVELTQPDEVEIVWSPDGHHSSYQAAFLYTQSHPEASNESVTTWDASLQQALPEFTHWQVLTDDAALFRWLHTLRDIGISLVRNVPIRRGEVAKVAERVGCLRASNFGAVFDVESKPEPNALAYTAHALPPHTDLVARELQPGFQFLHCLVFEAIGGESQLVDGFRAAERLRSADPAAFRLLCTTRVTFRQKEKTAELVTKSPIIRVDENDRVTEIRFSNAKRQPFDARVDDVGRLYEAYIRFMKLLRDPSQQVTLRLQPGDLLVFDNRRVLHGRTAFDPQSGPRHLQGCYVDRDDLLSRIRVLERTQAGFLGNDRTVE